MKTIVKKTLKYFICPCGCHFKSDEYTECSNAKTILAVEHCPKCNNRITKELII